MSIAKDSGYLLVSQAGVVAASLLSGVLTARLLGPEGKGQLYTLLQAVAFIGLVLSAGLGASYQYHIASKSYQKQAVVVHMLMQLLGTAILLLFLYGAGLTDLLGLHGSAVALRFTLLLTFINTAISFFSGILLSMSGGIRKNSLLGLLSSSANVVFLLLLLLIFRLDYMGAVYAYALAQLLKLLPMAVTVLRRTPLQPVPWFSMSQKLVGYGISAFIGNLMVSAVFRLDTFIIGYLQGMQQVGLYSVAVSFAEMALMVPGALGVSLFTHLPASGPEEQMLILARFSRGILLIALLVAIIIFAGGYPLVVLLMGRSYAPSVLPLLLLLPGVVTMSVNYVYSNYFSATGRPAVTAICFSAGVAANIGLNFLLVPSYGINGAAIASSISYSVITLLFILQLQHRQGLTVAGLLLIRREDLVPVKNRLAVMLSGFTSRIRRTGA